MRKRNVIAGTIFLVTALASNVVFAEGAQLTGNVSATSTYIWRGLPQTADAALQGGLQVDTDKGMYAGGWTSTVTGGSELDIYGGYKGKADFFNYDAGAIVYLYPQEPTGQSLNFFEIYADISRDFYGAKLSLSSDAGTYIEGYATLPLEHWNLGLHLGRYSVDDTYDGFKYGYALYSANPIKDDYFDFRIGASKDVGGFTVEFALSDTNLSGPLGDYRTTINVSKKFIP